MSERARAETRAGENRGIPLLEDGAVVDTGSGTGARAGTRLAARRRRVENARGRTLCPLIRCSVASTSDCGGDDGGCVGWSGAVEQRVRNGESRGRRTGGERGARGFERVDARTTRTRTMFADRVSSSTRARGEYPRAKGKSSHEM